MTGSNNKLIRNSTAEFLIFTGQIGEPSIERVTRTKPFCTQTQEGSLNEQK